MNNFEYYNPTRIVFGKGAIANLERLVPATARVMLIYGGGSIKRNGVYAQVKAALGARAVVEFGGIEPNPAYESCLEAAELARREGVDFLLAAGGGSVVDATKLIAALVPFTGDDPWQLFVQRGVVMPVTALPFGAVLTLPATGSEMNPIAVISRRETREKRAFDSELIYPRFSILDPEVTFSLPPVQVRNGIVDTFVHVVEQYLTYPADAPLQDRQAEAVFLTLIEEGPKALAHPADYATRATLMWCATHGLNRMLACGVPTDFATHQIGHELTAEYGLVHAESLAVVLPALWRLRKAAKLQKLSQFARRVWGVDEADPEQAADQAIERTVAFFHAMGMPTRLQDYGINAEEAARVISTRLGTRALGERKDVTSDVAADILRQA